MGTRYAVIGIAGLLALTAGACGSGWRGPQPPVTAVPAARRGQGGVTDLPIYPQWTFRHRSYLGARPVAVGPQLGMVDMQGRVLFVDPNSGKLTEELKVKGSLGTPLAWDEQRFYTVAAHPRRRLSAFSFKGAKRLWDKDFNDSPERPIRLGEDLLVTSGRALYALDPASGTTRDVLYDGPDIWLAPMAWADDVMLLGRGGQAAVLDSSGTVRWEVDLDAFCEFAPAIQGDAVYVSTTDGQVISLDVQGTELWRRQLDSTSLYTPRFAGDALVVAAVGGALWSLDAVTGGTRWTRTLSGPVAGAPHCDDRWIGVTTVDGGLWLLDPGSGQVTDSVIFDAIIHEPPVWAFGRLLITSNKTLYAYGTSP